jgi:hypothetical protein
MSVILQVPLKIFINVSFQKQISQFIPTVDSEFTYINHGLILKTTKPVIVNGIKKPGIIAYIIRMKNKLCTF